MAPIILNLNRNKIEVTSINYSDRELRFILHFDGNNDDFLGYPPERFCTVQGNAAGQYLATEGFIPSESDPTNKWKLFSGVIVHNNL